MRRRLRKKRHLGEFREWGLTIAIQRTHPDGFDDFLDDFIAQAIAAHGFACRGGGHGDRLTGVIEVALPQNWMLPQKKVECLKSAKGFEGLQPRQDRQFRGEI
jgi:uncharacterized protein YggL (DUF469 family)